MVNAKRVKRWTEAVLDTKDEPIHNVTDGQDLMEVIERNARAGLFYVKVRLFVPAGGTPDAFISMLTTNGYSFKHIDQSTPHLRQIYEVRWDS